MLRALRATCAGVGVLAVVAVPAMPGFADLDHVRPAGQPYGWLSGATASAPDDAWAVGYSYRDPDSGGARTTTEHWDGSAWSLVASPNPGHHRGTSLAGVSGASASDVWAVGSYDNDAGDTPLSLHWDGHSWTVVDTAAQARPWEDLKAVSADSSDDAWAVGDTWAAPGLRSTGWSSTGRVGVVTVKLPAGRFDAPLGAVSALSPDDVWAVGSYFRGGDYEKGLALHWDGSIWTRVPTPNPYGQFGADLVGVSALGPDDVWMVGYGRHHGFVLHWDGSAVTQVSVPLPAKGYRWGLACVAAAATDDVWIGGSYAKANSDTFSALFLHWDGTKLNLAPAPHAKPGHSQQLGAIATAGSNSAIAAGEATTPKQQDATVPVLAHWDGTQWIEP